MIELLEKVKSFLETFKILKTQDLFPRRMISEVYNYSYIFDFEVLFAQEFFEAIKSRVNAADDFYFLVVTDPDPLKYFMEIFTWIPAIKIDKKLSFMEYIQFLNADPGGSPADAIIFNSNQVVIADKAFKEVFIFIRELQIGIGYFADLEVMNQIKIEQNFGLIDPSQIDTIPKYLQALVKEYEQYHSFIKGSS